jgi:hypothetical protein
MGRAAEERAREQRIRRLLAVGASTAAVGIALSLNASSGVEILAATVTLLGVAAAMLGLHRFGRTGTDRRRLVR